MASNHDKQLENIFAALGPKGRFTKLQIFVLWLGMMPAGMQLLSNVFIGPQVPHRCARLDNDSRLLQEYQEAYDNVTIKYRQCEIQVLSHDTVVNTEKCIFGMEYDLPLDSSFVSQFDLVCESTNLARLTQTLVIGGQAFGAIIGSLLADKIGRKTVLVGANFGLMATGLTIAFSSNFVMFCIFKFIVGGFQQATVAVMSTLGLELFTIKDRRIAAMLMGFMWASGVVTLDLVALCLKSYSWRTVQMALSFGSLPVFLEIFFLRESLRWLMANGKTKQASAHIRAVAKMNGKKAEDILAALQLMPTVDDSKSPQSAGDGAELILKASKKLSYLDIFRSRHLLLNTLILWVAWFTTALGFFTIYMSSSSLTGDIYLNFLLTALMEVPSNIFFYFALNRFGRKMVMITIFMTLSGGIIGSGIFRSLEETPVNSTLAIIFNMIAMIGASGSFGISFQYTPELFPTNIRNQALGISSMVGRIGGMLAPFMAVLSEQAKWIPGVLIGCLALLVSFLLRFVPETNGRELPQTIEELEVWFKNKDRGDEKKVTKRISTQKEGVV